MEFKDIKMDEEILRAVNTLGFLKLTEIQDDVKLIEEIAKAVEIVMRNPRHEE